MTKNATQFISPITFETLTGNKCLVDTFDRSFEFSVEHVAIAKQADVSISTVSRVLNHYPHVKKATRDRVLEVLKRLNYVPQTCGKEFKGLNYDFPV